MNQIEYIGKQIRKYRKSRSWSAGQLGAMLDPVKSESAVTSWERGRTQPDGDLLIQLCRIFEVEVADFYYNPPSYSDSIGSETEFSADPFLEDVRQVFKSLTDKGKQKVVEYAKDLARADYYTKREEVRNDRYFEPNQEIA